MTDKQRGNREHEAPVRGNPMRPARHQTVEGRLVTDKPPSEWAREEAEKFWNDDAGCSIDDKHGPGCGHDIEALAIALGRQASE